MRSKEIQLASRPVAMPEPEHFRIVETEVPAPAEGEVMVRNLFMAVDPAMRGRMYDSKSYVPPFELDAPMEGPAVGEVVESRDTRFAPGDLVFHRLGWREAFTAPAERLEQREKGILPPQAHLTFAGVTGLTAYAGMLHVGGLKPGDVVFVSAASGGVGSLAAQIAKIKGHKVIGAAGGPEKAAFLLEKLGLDAAIDYKAEANLTKALARELKGIGEKGIDLYFDNVGGEHLHAALAVANDFARFPICGMISQYNLGGNAPMAPRNLMLMMGKRIRMQGYIANDHKDLWQHCMADMAAWHRAGLLHSAETIHDGIDNALKAFFGLFTGENLGRTLVKLG
ncbi:NADP-dependent oxidoreductase [Croceicoccus estronivorus]|uniref:NADP-dependent oxidoreductase n=1 Tax=Croceicoccus estronivorus TaxID=1172626 RepID=UPI000833BB20|nr:NADP-dependent oxidoreductase [Croceicoccus estronivorus]OCC23500.1 NADP-dependent oxidoreductase [Croceicoccus estronivorus]